MIVEYKKRLVFTSLFSILVVFVASTHAYVLQGPHALDLMIENLGKAKSLFVSHKIIYYRAEFVDDLEQMIKNLEKRESLSNDDIKGLFKTFLMVQIENTKFVGEMANAINDHAKEINELSSKIS